MFENLQISKISIENPVVLALYGIGRTDGLVCSSGESSTYTLASYNGYLIESAVKKTKIAGSAVTDHLTGLLQAEGIQSTDNASLWRYQVQELKEKLCFVSMNPL